MVVAKYQYVLQQGDTELYLPHHSPPPLLLWPRERCLGSAGPFRRLRLQTDPDDNSDPTLNRIKSHLLLKSKAQGLLGHRIAQGSTLPSPLAWPSSKTNASPQLPTASPRPAQVGLGGRAYPFPNFLSHSHSTRFCTLHTPKPPQAVTTPALLLQLQPTSAATIPSDAQRTGPT